MTPSSHKRESDDDHVDDADDGDALRGATDACDDVDSQADLDEFAKAAIHALRSRDHKRAKHAVDKRKSVVAASSPAGIARPVKPAPVKHARKVKHEGMVTREVGDGSTPVRVKRDPVTVTTTSPMPRPAPNMDAPPSNYNKGRIYWKCVTKKFRVIRQFPIYKTERVVSWKATHDCRTHSAHFCALY